MNDKNFDNDKSFDNDKNTMDWNKTIAINSKNEILIKNYSKNYNLTRRTERKIAQIVSSMEPMSGKIPLKTKLKEQKFNGEKIGETFKMFSMNNFHQDMKEIAGKNVQERDEEARTYIVTIPENSSPNDLDIILIKSLLIGGKLTSPLTDSSYYQTFSSFSSSSFNQYISDSLAEYIHNKYFDKIKDKTSVVTLNPIDSLDLKEKVIIKNLMGTKIELTNEELSLLEDSQIINMLNTIILNPQLISMNTTIKLKNFDKITEIAKKSKQSKKETFDNYTNLNTLNNNIGTIIAIILKLINDEKIMNEIKITDLYKIDLHSKFPIDDDYKEYIVNDFLNSIAINSVKNRYNELNIIISQDSIDKHNKGIKTIKNKIFLTVNEKSQPSQLKYSEFFTNELLKLMSENKELRSNEKAILMANKAIEYYNNPREQMVYNDYILFLLYEKRMFTTMEVLEFYMDFYNSFDSLYKLMENGNFKKFIMEYDPQLPLQWSYELVKESLTNGITDYYIGEFESPQTIISGRPGSGKTIMVDLINSINNKYK